MSGAEPLPLLDLRIDPEAIVEGYPFDVPAVRTLREIRFDSAVTLFVGENGTGKSTLLEAVALAADLPSAGTTELARDSSLDPVRPLAAALRLGWSARLRHGCFFRAEDFLGFMRRVEATRAELRAAADQVAIDKAAQGEGEVRRAQAPYTGQIAALTARHGEDAEGRSHGESFLSYPGATILSFDGGRIERVRFDDLEHVRLTRSVLADPEAFTHRL